MKESQPAGTTSNIVVYVECLIQADFDSENLIAYVGVTFAGLHPEAAMIMGFSSPDVRWPVSECASWVRIAG